MCTSFSDASVSLCSALASVARYLSTTRVDSAELMPFVACRLIPLAWYISQNGTERNNLTEHSRYKIRNGML